MQPFEVLARREKSTSFLSSRLVGVVLALTCTVAVLVIATTRPVSTGLSTDQTHGSAQDQHMIHTPQGGKIKPNYVPTSEIEDYVDAVLGPGTDAISEYGHKRRGSFLVRKFNSGDFYYLQVKSFTPEPHRLLVVLQVS